MGSTGSDKVPSGDLAQGSETTIEIKLKTLDSQTYSLKVDKQVSVPALKEQIASVTGVLSEQQRLICRGRVLKDDQLLSAYHVEDGHTLHLVVRQPAPPSNDGLNMQSADPASFTSRGRSHSVVIESLDSADGVPPEISRIVSAVLSSFGFSNIGNSRDGTDVREIASQRAERTLSGSLGMEAVQLQPEQTSTRSQSDRAQSAFGLPGSVSLGSLSPPVIPDSLSTLSQYLSHMRREFDTLGRNEGNNNQVGSMSRNEETGSDSAAASRTGGLPTPASLAQLILSSRQMILEQAAERLLQFGIQLEDQANITDPTIRSNTQSNAWRTGEQLLNLGAFLLELGRTTMTLRLGQTPSEAVVNAGPAVFISSSGPNPLMVQPLPFQSGTSFGAVPMGTVQPGPSLFSGLGGGFLPRRIDIQIRRASSAATPNNNQEERSDPQQPSGQRNPVTGPGENSGNQPASRAPEGSSFASESGVRVVPLRTMVAAVPGSLSRESSGGSIGLYYPFLGRFQHVSSGQVSGERGSQASGDLNPPSVQPGPESAAQQRNGENATAAREGSTQNPRQHRQPTARGVNVNILLSARNNQESERQMPNATLQFLRSLFPGSEVHMDSVSMPGLAAGPVPESFASSSATTEEQPRATEEGIFLSNLLREIMPAISQHVDTESTVTPGETHSAGNGWGIDSSSGDQISEAGTSRSRENDAEPCSPNAKRQKTE